MKKAYVLGLAVILLGGIAACKKDSSPTETPAAAPAELDYTSLGKYADVGPVMDKMIQANEKYVDALEKAENAEQVAAAINGMTDAMIEMAPAMKAIEEKFPEFKTQEEPPAELKPLNDKLMAVMMRMFGVMNKLTEYESDPLVAAAQERYNKAMEDMR